MLQDWQNWLGLSSVNVCFDRTSKNQYSTIVYIYIYIHVYIRKQFHEESKFVRTSRLTL